MVSKIANPAVKRVEGLVAQILDERQLVINIGAEAGVKPGMKFSVLSATSLEIKDPATHEILDTVDREKVRVEARDVRPKVTICRTYRTYHTGGLLDFFEPRREVKESLNAEASSMAPPLARDDSYVKISDRVVQVDDE